MAIDREQAIQAVEKEGFLRFEAQEIADAVLTLPDPVADAPIGETTPCADCGRPHGDSSGSYWLTSDAMWSEVVGDSTIVLCIPCFTSRAREMGVEVFWQPVRAEAPSPVADAAREVIEAWTSDPPFAQDRFAHALDALDAALNGAKS